jgi:hypothetical protein
MDSDIMESDRMSNSANVESDRMESGRNQLKNKSGGRHHLIVLKTYIYTKKSENISQMVHAFDLLVSPLIFFSHLLTFYQIPFYQSPFYQIPDLLNLTFYQIPFSQSPFYQIPVLMNLTFYQIPFYQSPFYQIPDLLNLTFYQIPFYQSQFYQIPDLLDSIRFRISSFALFYPIPFYQIQSSQTMLSKSTAGSIEKYYCSIFLWLGHLKAETLDSG